MCIPSDLWIFFWAPRCLFVIHTDILSRMVYSQYRLQIEPWIGHKQLNSQSNTDPQVNYGRDLETTRTVILKYLVNDWINLEYLVYLCTPLVAKASERPSELGPLSTLFTLLVAAKLDIYSLSREGTPGSAARYRYITVTIWRHIDAKWHHRGSISPR